MSKQANPAKIGLFIVVGMVLGIAALIVFSSSRLFSDIETYVLYFDASVKGLNPGAPVKMRGVTVGTVREVRIRFHQEDHDLSMPVIIEINEDLIREKTDASFDIADEATYERMVRDGLRGMLEAQSLVTGLLYVELEILPNATPPVFHQVRPVHREIPTAHTDIQQLMENLARLDLAGISDKLNVLLDKMDTSLGELQVAEINRGLTNLLVSVNRLVDGPEVTNLLASATVTVTELGQLSRKLAGRVDPFADGAQTALADASVTLEEIQLGVQMLRDLLAPHAPLRRELTSVVEDLGATARSVSTLADFLTRNPNALISGRQRVNRLSP